MHNDTAQLEVFLRHLHLGAEVYYVGQLCDAWHIQLARMAGWHLKSTWRDDDDWFNVHYFSQSAVAPLKLAR